MSQMPPDPGPVGPPPSNPPLNEVLAEWASRHSIAATATGELSEALTAREDRIVEHLHMAGMQFGLYPQIIAEVLATVGLGTPPSVEGRALIRHQFVALMEELQRQQGGGGGTI